MKAKYTWDRRIERAEELAKCSPYAQDVLAFYKEILNWQRDLYEQITAASVDRALTGFFEQDHLLFINNFASLLEIVMRRGSGALAAHAEKLDSVRDGWEFLLKEYWHGELDLKESFFARTCLQPYLERLADSRIPPADSRLMGLLNTRIDEFVMARPEPICRFCGRKPLLAALTNETQSSDLSDGAVDGGRRFLMCGECQTSWPFQRLACVNCPEENPQKLSYYRAESLPEYRVDCCDTCRSYIKTIDLTRNNRCVPTVDELAAIPLDLWARERGYHKVFPNLAGL